MTATTKPSVLFVYVHNAARSQIAAGPAGQGIDAVRLIRDEIRRRIDDLITELT
jgi:hypothetical protein